MVNARRRCLHEISASSSTDNFNKNSENPQKEKDTIKKIHQIKKKSILKIIITHEQMETNRFRFASCFQTQHSILINEY